MGSGILAGGICTAKETGGLRSIQALERDQLAWQVH
jgi:hypothetical protein